MNSSTEWALPNNLKLILNCNNNGMTVEVIHQLTKDIWSSSQITNEAARRLTENLFSVEELKGIIKHAIEGTRQDVRFALTENNQCLILEIFLAIVNTNKTFKLELTRKEVAEVWKLTQIIHDLRTTIQNMENRMQKVVQDINNAELLFRKWRGDMISYHNTSHTPTSDDQRLSIMNNVGSNVIAWDGKNFGWIQFTFDSPLACVATRFINGASVWDIEYSDDGQAWNRVATFRHGVDVMCRWQSAGAHKYWRYNMVQNTGTPYYNGFEWYYAIEF